MKSHVCYAVFMIGLFCAFITHAQEKMVSASEAQQRGWPNISGPKGNFHGLPSETPLLDNLSLARLAWTSEAAHFGAGKAGGVSRKNRELLLKSFGEDRVNWAGSMSGPIVKDGVVYVASFRPAGPVRAFKGMYMDRKPRQFDEPVELQVEAEDTLTAIDVETGKTIWTFAHPGGYCWTQGKRGGHQIAPAIYENKVYFVGTQGDLYCVDAKTGKKLWQGNIGWAHDRMKMSKDYYLNGENMKLDKREARKYRAFFKIEDGIYREPYTPTWHGGVRVIDGVVICNDGGSGLIALNIETGKQLWSRGGVNSFMAAPSMWEHEGKQYILTAGPAQMNKKGSVGKGFLRLINPHDGQDIWVEEIGPTYPTLAPYGDLVLVNTRQPAKKEDLNSGLLGCYELSMKGAKKLWVLPDESKYYIDLKKDSLGRFRYNIQGDRAFIGTKGGGKDRRAGRFLILEARTGKILVESADRNKITRVGTHMWYVIGDRIYSTWDRHHSPMRGGRKPIVLSKWDDKGITTMRDETGIYALDLANVTGGYEVTMEHPIVDGRMFERTTDGRLVCYDLRQLPNEKVYHLKAEGAWRGLGEALPIDIRVVNGEVMTGAVHPGSSRLLGQIHTTARTADFWRDSDVSDIDLSEGKLMGLAKLETVGAAMPGTFIGLTMNVTVAGDQLKGSWSREIAGLEKTIKREASIEGGFSKTNRFAFTPWLSHQPRTSLATLKPGQTNYVLNLATAMPNINKDAIPGLSLSLVHDGERFTAGSGGAFRFSQAWHEVDATGLTLKDGKFTGTVVVILHGDNYTKITRPDGQPGLWAGLITIDAKIEGERVVGKHSVEWGVPYKAKGAITGVISKP